MFKNLISMYRPSFVRNISYMLQASEYDPIGYLKWLNRTKNFNSVSKRKEFVKTKLSVLLYRLLWLGISTNILIGLIIVVLGISHKIIGGIYYGIAIILIYPLVWSYIILGFVMLANHVIIEPRNRVKLSEAESIFKNHKGKIIAVLGSYGKTSMKEFLLTVLSEGSVVAASKANKNVALSHASFSKSLTGKEDVIIVEFGEGKKGDIALLAKLTHPDIAVITGLAPAHQNHYKNLNEQAKDLLSIINYVDKKNIYLNKDSAFGQIKLPSGINLFDNNGINELKISKIDVSFEDTKFELTNGNKKINLITKVIGSHQVKYLTLVAYLAMKLGRYILIRFLNI